MMKPAIFFIFLFASMASSAQILSLNGKKDSLTRSRISRLLISRRPSAFNVTMFEVQAHYTFVFRQPNFFQRRLPEYYPTNYFGTGSGIRNPRLFYLTPNRYKFMDDLRARERGE